MKVLLFDLDGTLIRARGAGRKALNRAIYRLHGIRRDFGIPNLAGRTDLYNFAQAFRAALGRAPSRAEAENIHREYLRLLPGFVRQAVNAKAYRVMPGLRRLLAILHKDERVLLGLGTGNLEAGARIKLGPSGLLRYFRFGGFGADGLERYRLLRAAVRRARPFAGGRPIRPRDVFVIGDTPFDVAAGRKAGYRTIAVGTGYATMAELAAARPDRLEKDFRDTESWLAGFGLRPRAAGRKRERSEKQNLIVRETPS